MRQRRRYGTAYDPTEEDRKRVQAAAAVGMPQERIARMLRITHGMLKKHFSYEISCGSDNAVVDVGECLYANAMSGNTAAQIFWMKTRGGFKETGVTELVGANGEPLNLAPPALTIKFLTAPATTDLTQSTDPAAIVAQARTPALLPNPPAAPD